MDSQISAVIWKTGRSGAVPQAPEKSRHDPSDVRFFGVSSLADSLSHYVDHLGFTLNPHLGAVISVYRTKRTSWTRSKTSYGF